MTTAQLHGLNVLIVEDDPIVGMLIEDILLKEGCHISGPYITLSTGIDAAETEAVDVAVLDVNLAGKVSYPIGEVLSKRGIPFVLTSGYGDSAAPAEHSLWPVCSKPFSAETLTAAIKSLICKGPQPTG